MSGTTPKQILKTVGLFKKQSGNGVSKALHSPKWAVLNENVLL